MTPADITEVVEKVEGHAHAHEINATNGHSAVVREAHGKMASDLRALLAHVSHQSAEIERLERLPDATPFKDALHDLVMLKAQQDIGCVPAPTRAQWKAAWDEAEELTRVEP